MVWGPFSLYRINNNKKPNKHFYIRCQSRMAYVFGFFRRVIWKYNQTKTSCDVSGENLGYKDYS